MNFMLVLAWILIFLMLLFRLLILGQQWHFLGFDFICNLWKETEHFCVSPHRILNSETTQPTP